MTSLLCNWFDDWGMAIKDGLGQTGLIVMTAVFACLALGMLSSLFTSTLRKSIRKNKMVFHWVQLLFMIIFLLFTIWFGTLI